jgi:hypothetical protein
MNAASVFRIFTSREQARFAPKQAETNATRRQANRHSSRQFPAESPACGHLAARFGYQQGDIK